MFVKDRDVYKRYICFYYGYRCTWCTNENVFFFVMNKDCVFVRYRAGVLFALGKGDGLLVK